MSNSKTENKAVDKLLLLKQKLKNKNKSIDVIEKRACYPMSSSQKRMYVLNNIEGINTTYNIPSIRIVEGKFDITRFESSFRDMIIRHEILRTSFEIINDDVVQVVHDDFTFNIKQYDLKSESKEDIDELFKEFVGPFDLSSCPLLRVGIVRLSSIRHLLLFDIHHIITDGISNGIFFDELMKLYNGIKLDRLPIQYKDFSEWQNKLFASEKIENQKQYWINQFSNGIPLLMLPLDYPRPGKKTFNGNTINTIIPDFLGNRIDSLLSKFNITPNILFYCLYSILLCKYSAQEDIVIGSLVAGRNHADLESLIGMFLNFLPINNSVSKNLRIIEYIEKGKYLIINAYDNQDYPFEEIIGNVDLPIDFSRNPLFDTMFIYHSHFVSKNGVKSDDFHFSEHKTSKNTSTLDIKLDMYVDQYGKYHCVFEYNTDLFATATIEHFIESYKELLYIATTDPEIKINEIKLFSEAEEVEFQQKRLLNNGSQIRKEELVVSATFTADPLDGYLKWWSSQFNLDLLVAFSSYNQVFQDLLDEDSLFNRTAGLKLLLVRFEDWIRADDSSESDQCRKFTEYYEELESAFNQRNNHSLCFVGIFPVSTHLGFSDTLISKIESLTERWFEYLNDQPNVYLIDFRGLDFMYSIVEIFDAISDKEGHIPFSEAFYAGMSKEISRYIYALKSKPFKVLVLDCDNTLWSGVCGEDGALGVTISNGHKLFQEFMVNKYDEGMLLTLCSKNNEEDVWSVFANHPDMILKREHFADWRINWESKSANIRSLAADLNLGLDSFIFLDDNPVECMDVMSNVPEALTLQVPEDYAEISGFLNHVWAFDKFDVTSEDRLRSQSYINEKKRNNLKDSSVTLDDFLAKLELEITISLVKDSQLPRVAQLIARTNQFNMSSIRRNESEVAYLLKSNDLTCRIVNVSDRFGDYGLVGVVITKEDDTAVFIDTFLLSCRVLGRGVEDRILQELRDYCKRVDKQLQAKYVITEKNIPFKKFIDRSGWKLALESKNGVMYTIPLDYILEDVDESKQELVDSDETVGINKESTGLLRSQESIHQLSLEYNLGEKLLGLVAYLIEKKSFDKEEYVAPRDSIEKQISKIFEELLNINRVGVNENFFELGGHSIMAIRLLSNIKKEFNCNIQIDTFFQNSTIADFTKIVKVASEGKGIMPEKASLVGLKHTGSKVPFFCVPPPGSTPYGYFKKLASHLSSEQSFYGFLTPSIGGEQEKNINIEDIARECILEMCNYFPEGPYKIGGFCNGGVIAFEMAKQLVEVGKEVASLVLFDAFAPSEQIIDGYLSDVEWAMWFASDLSKLLAGYYGGEVSNDFKINPESLKGKDLNEKLQIIMDEAKKEKIVSDKTNVEEIYHGYKFFKDNNLKNLLIINQYNPEPYSGDMALFVSKEGQANKEQNLGWDRLISENIYLQYTAGNHETILQEPNVIKLANDLEKYLEEKKKV